MGSRRLHEEDSKFCDVCDVDRIMVLRHEVETRDERLSSHSHLAWRGRIERQRIAPRFVRSQLQLRPGLRYGARCILYFHRKIDGLLRGIGHVGGQCSERSPICSYGRRRKFDQRSLGCLKVDLKCVISIRGKTAHTHDGRVKCGDALQILSPLEVQQQTGIPCWRRDKGRHGYKTKTECNSDTHGCPITVRLVANDAVPNPWAVSLS